MSKKILLVAEASTSGGTKTYLKQLMYLYSSIEGLSITLVCSIKDQEIEELAKNLKIDFYSLHEISSKKSHVFSAVSYRQHIDQKVFKPFYNSIKPDILVISSGTPGLFFSLIPLSINSLYVLHTYPEFDSRFIQSKLKTLILKSYLTSNCTLVTVSRYSKSRLIDNWRVDDSKVNLEVVYSTCGAPAESDSHEKNCAKNILTLGHLVDYKAPDIWFEVAIEVIKSNQEVEVHFHWLGEGHLLEKYQALVKQSEYQDRIHLYGHIQDVARFYREADVYFQPSRIESLGLSVIDALRYGVPSVVSDCGGLPEVVDHLQNGFVNETDNINEFVKSITALLSDEVIASQFAINAKKKYEDRFSYEEWSKNILQISGLDDHSY